MREMDGAIEKGKSPPGGYWSLTVLPQHGLQDAFLDALREDSHGLSNVWLVHGIGNGLNHHVPKPENENLRRGSRKETSAA